MNRHERTVALKKYFKAKKMQSDKEKAAIKKAAAKGRMDYIKEKAQYKADRRKAIFQAKVARARKFAEGGGYLGAFERGASSLARAGFRAAAKRTSPRVRTVYRRARASYRKRYYPKRYRRTYRRKRTSNTYGWFD